MGKKIGNPLLSCNMGQQSARDGAGKIEMSGGKAAGRFGKRIYS
jgi:hypothetical protein